MKIQFNNIFIKFSDKTITISKIYDSYDELGYCDEVELTNKEFFICIIYFFKAKIHLLIQSLKNKLDV